MDLALHSHMPIRITSVEESHGLVVRVDGWLEACDVATLEEAVGDDVRRTRLDLSELRSADAAGVVALRGLEGRGARLHGAPPFLRLLLEAAADHDHQPGASDD